MNARKFYDKVSEMRIAQKKCLECTDMKQKQNWIEIRNRLENEIDAEIERVEEILRKKEKSKKQIDNAVKLLNEKGFALETVV